MARISCVPARSSARVAQYSRMISFLLLVLMALVALLLSGAALATLAPRRILAGRRLNRIRGGALRGRPVGGSLPGWLCPAPGGFPFAPPSRTSGSGWGRLAFAEIRQL